MHDTLLAIYIVFVFGRQLKLATRYDIPEYNYPYYDGQEFLSQILIANNQLSSQVLIETRDTLRVLDWLAAYLFYCGYIGCNAIDTDEHTSIKTFLH